VRWWFAPHGILKPLGPRGRAGEHRKGKRTGGHRAIEASQQRVVGGVLGHYVEAAGSGRPGARMAKAHTTGILHRVQSRAVCPGARVPRWREAAGCVPDRDAGPRDGPTRGRPAARQAEAPKGHQQAHREDTPGEGGRAFGSWTPPWRVLFENAVLDARPLLSDTQMWKGRNSERKSTSWQSGQTGLAFSLPIGARQPWPIVPRVRSTPRSKIARKELGQGFLMKMCRDSKIDPRL